GVGAKPLTPGRPPGRLVARMSREKDGQPHRAIADGWAVKEGFGGAVMEHRQTGVRHGGTLGG
ncbi:MAG: hypothetical protein ACODAD_16475, partial [Planctomycetota bacterium]